MRKIHFWGLSWIIVIFMQSVFVDEIKLGILFNKNFIGESAFAYRINLACKSLGWDTEIINEDQFENFTGDGFSFVICLTPGNYTKIKCKKFLTIFLPENYNDYYDKNGSFIKEYNDFDAYLTPFNPLDYPKIRRNFKDLEHRFLCWYPTVHNIKIQAKQRKNLFIINAAWGARIKADKYIKLFYILSKQKDVAIYGRNSNRIKTKGIIPFEGDSLYQIAANCGISLVIHSDVHRNLGVPTGRIFEAAALKNVIICDRHPFVEQIFGSNILYIDVDLNYLEIFNQIRSHIEWIKQHPLEADQMAKNVHQIFQKRFLLENQLLELKHF